jgi:hypothetical protein
MTVVEWLEKELIWMDESKNTPYIDLKIKQALEMEKKQIHASIDKQVNILKDTLDEMMTGFESEEDRMDFILDICNGYKTRNL